MTADVRIPAEADREQIAHVLSTSLHFPLEAALARSPTFPLDDMRCAYVDDRVVATAAESPFTQWFGGNGLACSGVWGVATEPERRGAGLASACLGRLMDDARRRGTPLTALFPAVVEPYRRLGYELAGTYDEHRIALDVLPTVDKQDLPSVELAEVERDQDAIMACYAHWLARRNGAIEPDATFWRTRLLERPWDEWHRAVVARDGGTITGFATFTRANDSSGHLSFGFGLKCSMFVAEDDRALRALIAYARGYRGLGRWLGWSGPPNDPMTMLVGVQAVEVADRYRWMLRVLDVRAALEGRGYPPIDAEATFAIDRSSIRREHWRLARATLSGRAEGRAGAVVRPATALDRCVLLDVHRVPAPGRCCPARVPRSRRPRRGSAGRDALGSRSLVPVLLLKTSNTPFRPRC